MSVKNFYADSWQAQSPGLSTGISNRSEALGQLLQGLQGLVETDKIHGNGADAMKSYISEVHVSLIQLLLVTLNTFQTAVGVYWDGYNAVDTNGNFKLIVDELTTHSSQLETGKTSIDTYGSRLRNISNSVSHIVSLGSAGASSLDSVKSDFDAMKQTATNLKETWESYESSNAGFDQVEEMIAKLKDLVNNVGNVTVGQGRSYQSGSFSQALDGVSSLFSQMSEYCESNASIASDAWQAMFDGYVEDVNRAAEAKAKEEAKKELFWAVVGAVVAGVLIVATAGTATPLVMAGLALDGALAMNQLVASGSKFATGKEFNPLVKGLTALGMDEKLANTTVTVANFATLAIGGSVGLVKLGSKAVKLAKAGELTSTVAKGLGKIPRLPAQAGQSILTHFNQAKSSASAFGKTFMTELSKGGVTTSLNGAGDLTKIGKATVAGAKEAKSVFKASGSTGKTLSRVMDDGADIKKASGAGKKLSVDDLTKELLETKPKNSRDPRKWLDKGGEIDVLDDGTWVYTNTKGQSVKYTNGFPDFKEAGLVQQEVNIGEFTNYANDFKKADKLAPNGPRDAVNNTWHHHQDLETLQEVDKAIHKEFTHKGGMALKKRK